MSRALANRADVVRHDARELARAAFVAAGADALAAARLVPEPSRKLLRQVGPMTDADLRHHAHQYREELHVLGLRAELAVRNGARRAGAAHV